jgi:hypothetical protein
MQQFSLRDVPDKCQMPFCTFYIGYYTFSLHKKPAGTSSKTLVLKRMLNGIQLCFPLFVARMDTQRPGQDLLTCPVIQLAAEHMPECTAQRKIKNTASHIIKTVSGDHTVSYSMAI